MPEIVFVNDLISSEVSQRFKDVPPEIPIVLIGQLRYDTVPGSLVSWQNSTTSLVEALRNPLYSISMRAIGYGAIGGYVLDEFNHGEQAAALAKRVLSGEAIEDIPPEYPHHYAWVFDFQKLRQYDISQKLLPQPATLINRPQTFYHQYKTLVWQLVISFALALSFIVFLIEIIRRSIENQKIIQENEARYKDLAAAGANVFWETDSDLKFCYVSGDTDYFYGMRPEKIIGLTLGRLFEKNGNVSFPWAEYTFAIKSRQPLNNLKFTVKLSDERLRICLLNGKPIFDRNQTFVGYRGINREITEEYNLSKTIAYQATYDALTGLVNRREFNSQLSVIVEQARQTRSESVLCFLDLDRFKLVNDSAGHLVGDALLTKVAEIFQQSTRRQDVIGRLGGDEFGMILVDTPLAKATEICQRLIKRIEDFRFRWDDRIFHVGVSAGMVSVLNKLDVVELLSKADFACYKSKELGRGRLSIASDADDAINHDQKAFGYLANIGQAIERNQFYLVKQPIRAINASEVSHYELLIRYSDDQGNSIPPSAFIPHAERHGVITLIDRWVVQHIFDCYHSYFPAEDTTISINLSAISISNTDFVSWLKNAVDNCGISPERICFEITETAAISQLSQALDFMGSMRERGVRFALDDFGSGVASFNYLKTLPIDFLKIDGSLIRNIVSNDADRAIVSAVHKIADMMGIKTIAEFVENSEIERVLCGIGINYAQGYGIGKPIRCELPEPL